MKAGNVVSGAHMVSPNFPWLRFGIAGLAGILLAGCTPPTPPADACKGRVAGDLVISEILNDPPGTDTGKEYVELYNTTGSTIELKGMTIYVSKGDGTGEKTHVIRAGAVPAGAYYAVGDVRGSDPLPPYIGYSYDDALGALPNSDGIVGVRCGTTKVDEVKYVSAPKAGHARTFDGDKLPDAAGNDDETSWCDAPKELSGVTGTFGSPGQANDSCKATAGGTCMDSAGARLIVLPEAGDVVISELMPDPAGVSDTVGEWIELYANVDVDLNGSEISTPTAKSVFTSDKCLKLRAGTYGVIARNADTALNGGVNNVMATYNFGLVNSGSNVFFKTGDTVIDAIAYKGATSGVSLQLDPKKLDTTLNDDAAAYCFGTAAYGTSGNKGTPGAPNLACPPTVGANECLDPTNGQPRMIRAPVEGDLVITEFMANPKAVDDPQGEWIEVLVKTDVDLNGIELGNEGTSTSALTSNACIRPGAGNYALFARSADPAVNGGLPDKITGTFTFSLSNTGARAINVKRNAAVLDSISYSTSGDGISSQLDVNQSDHLLNNDAGSFCPSRPERTYYYSADGGTQDGGDRGTPGVANDPCP